METAESVEVPATGDNAPGQLAERMTSVASISEIAVRVIEALNHEDVQINDVSALIELDPALSASLLRVANSAIYGSVDVDSVHRALNIVGMRQLKDMVISIGVCNAFAGIPYELITVEDFWKHSLYCAVIAQLVSKRCGVCKNDSIFPCGLLHDVGHLVMFTQAPELSTRALRLSLEQNDGLAVHESERQVFGFDHMDVGAALANEWHLPPSMTNCIKFHHNPYESPEPDDSLKVVALANSLAVLAELDSHCLDDTAPIDPQIMTDIGFEESMIEEIVAESRETVAELLVNFVHH